jgi:hypothetical protein
MGRLTVGHFTSVGQLVFAKLACQFSFLAIFSWLKINKNTFAYH